MEIALMIYFFVNAFIAGYYFCLCVKEHDMTWFNKFMFILLVCHIGLLMELWDLIKYIANRIDTFFQVRLFWNYLFTDKCNNLSAEQLSKLNKGAKRKDPSKLQDRIYIYIYG